MAAWYIRDGDIPYLNEFPEMISAITDGPNIKWHSKYGNIPYQPAFPDTIKFTDAPLSMWIMNDGNIPYKSIFPKMYKIRPIHIQPLYQPPYICVYDMHEKQNNFDGNGLAILIPTVCEITEELNGMYELTLEHPFDEEGRWKHLLELNIIKANGQLFRIYNKYTVMDSDGSKRRIVRARHIFYDLNDKLLLDVRPENKDGAEFIDYIMERIYDDDPQKFYPTYEYKWDSDITNTATSYFIGKSVTGALLGEENCFVNRLGGEIHRDNFFFSINTRKQTSRANSFNIRYGVDMIDVEETIDYSELITNLMAKDNFGNRWEVSFRATPRLHHNISKYVMFSYEENDEAVFQKDVEDYFRTYCQPSINYKVTFANFKNCELYEGFEGLQECNIGDTGEIFCEELGISTSQKIIKKTIDVLTGSTVSVELGNLNSSLTRRDKYAGILTTETSADKAAAAAAEEARKIKCANMRVWEDGLQYVWKDFTDSTWGEIYNPPKEDEEE